MNYSSEATPSHAMATLACTVEPLNKGILRSIRLSAATIAFE